jgi:hypothetical protein
VSIKITDRYFEKRDSVLKKRALDFPFPPQLVQLVLTLLLSSPIFLPLWTRFFMQHIKERPAVVISAGIEEIHSETNRS